MQEPDSFSQGIVRALKFPDTALELFNFGLVVSDFLGTRSFQRGPFAMCAGHIPMIPWNQGSVEVTFKHHLPPLPKRPIRH